VLLRAGAAVVTVQLPCQCGPHWQAVVDSDTRACGARDRRPAHWQGRVPEELQVEVHGVDVRLGVGPGPRSHQGGARLRVGVRHWQNRGPSCAGPNSGCHPRVRPTFSGQHGAHDVTTASGSPSLRSTRGTSSLFGGHGGVGITVGQDSEVIMSSEQLETRPPVRLRVGGRGRRYEVRHASQPEC
jgi:hypothetical protein